MLMNRIQNDVCVIRSYVNKHFQIIHDKVNIIYKNKHIYEVKLKGSGGKVTFLMQKSYKCFLLSNLLY